MDASRSFLVLVLAVNISPTAVNVSPKCTTPLVNRPIIMDVSFVLTGRV